MRRRLLWTLLLLRLALSTVCTTDPPREPGARTERPPAAHGDDLSSLGYL